MTSIDHQFVPFTARLKTGQTMQVRAAMPEDAAALHAYATVCVPETTHGILMTADEYDRTVEQEREAIAAQDSAQGDLWLLAFEGDEVVASLSCQTRKCQRAVHFGQIGMAVRKRLWGQGLGGAMMRALVDWAIRHPVLERLELEVYADNASAIGLYEKLGFIELARLPKRFKFGPNDYRDDVLMWLDVRKPKQEGRSSGFALKVNDELSLRLAGPEHAQEFFALVERNRDHLSPWMSWVEATRSVEDIARVRREAVANHAKRSQLHLQIFEAQRIVGAIGLHDLDDPHRSAELGYWLDQEAQGRGLVTRSAKALLDYAFEEYNLHRAYLTADAKNARSIAVAQRLGMRREGEMKQDYLMPGGRYRDSVLYAVLADEWKGRTSWVW